MKWFEWRESTWGKYTFAVCSGVLFFVILEHIGSILQGVGHFIGFFTPVILGLILAYIMDFLVKFLQEKFFNELEPKRGRLISVIITTLLVVILLIMMILALIPQLVTSLTSFLANWDDYVANLSQLLGSLSSMSGNSRNTVDLTKEMDKLTGKISDYLSKNSGNIIETISSIGSKLATWLIAFIVAIYILLAKEDLLRSVKKLYRITIGNKYFDIDQVKRNEALAHINEIFSKYIVCEIVDALIIGFSNAAFMLIARMPYAAMISVVVGVTNLAPTFGPIVGGAIGAFILLLVKPTAVIPFLIFTCILQTIDGYVIKPKMYGGALSVPSVWILVSIIVLGRMFGVVGILLAIPVAAIITYWLREIMEDQEKKEKEKEEKSKKSGSTQRAKDDGVISGKVRLTENVQQRDKVEKEQR